MRKNKQSKMITLPVIASLFAGSLGTLFTPNNASASSNHSSSNQAAICLQIDSERAYEILNIKNLADRIELDYTPQEIVGVPATLKIGDCNFDLSDTTKEGGAGFLYSVQKGVDIIMENGVEGLSDPQVGGGAPSSGESSAELESSTLAAVVALELTGNGKMLADAGVIPSSTLSANNVIPSNLESKLTLLSISKENNKLSISKFSSNTNNSTMTVSGIPDEMSEYSGPKAELIERYNKLLLENPNVRAFFQLLKAHEGTTGNGWDSMYPSTTFDNGFKDHPRQSSPIEYGPYAGESSDAAGICQFISSTWDTLNADLKLSNFKPISQAYACLYDLDEKHGVLDELEKGDIEAVLAKVTSGEWPGLNTASVDEFKGYVKLAEGYEDIISQTFGLKDRLVSNENKQADSLIAVAYKLKKGSLVEGQELKSDIMVPAAEIEKLLKAKFGIEVFSKSGQFIYVEKGAAGEASNSSGTIETVPIDSIPEVELLFGDQNVLKTLKALAGSVRLTDKTGREVTLMDNPYGINSWYTYPGTAITDAPLTPLAGNGMYISPESRTAGMVDGGVHMGEDWTSFFGMNGLDYTYSDGSVAPLDNMIAYFRPPQELDIKLVKESWGGYGQNGIKIIVGEYDGFILELRIGHGRYYGHDELVTDDTELDRIVAGFNEQMQQKGEWVALAESALDGATSYPHYHAELNFLQRSTGARIFIDPTFLVEGHESALEELIPNISSTKNSATSLSFGYFKTNPYVGDDSGTAETAALKLSEYLGDHPEIVRTTDQVLMTIKKATGECNKGWLYVEKGFDASLGTTSPVYTCEVEDGKGHWRNPLSMEIDVGREELGRLLPIPFSEWQKKNPWLGNVNPGEYMVRRAEPEYGEGQCLAGELFSADGPIKLGDISEMVGCNVPQGDVMGVWDIEGYHAGKGVEIFFDTLGNTKQPAK